MSSSLYTALKASRPLTPSVISEGRDISRKAIKQTMVYLRRMDESIPGRAHSTNAAAERCKKAK